MYKKIAALLLCFCMLLLTSCSMSDLRAWQLTELMNEEADKIESESKEIIRCLTEKDKDGFCNLFSENARADEEFKKQVDEAFDFFQCDVYIKSDIDTTASGGENRESGKRTSWYVDPEISYIKVIISSEDDTRPMISRYYQISYDYQIIDQINPELEGLNYLRIELLNLEQSVEIAKLPAR